MVRIFVSSTLESRSYPNAGRALYNEIVSKAESADRIVLDFSGVYCVPSLYLNTSLGRLIKGKGYNLVKSKLSFANITKSQADRINKYVNCIR